MADDTVTITFNDENLYNAMAEKFTDEITNSGTNTDGTYYIVMAQDDIDSVTSLSFSSSEIVDITGIENFTSLTYLALESNEIVDISILTNLTGLTKLYLTGNEIEDISALSSLTELEVLYLRSNNIIDISAVSSLTNLTYLDLSSNEIVDISAISTLTNLTELLLYSNNIVDISAIANLENLSQLSIFSNCIEDMTILESMNIEDLSCSTQSIYITTSNYEEINLPQIFIQAQSSDSILYYGEDGSISTLYCTLNDDNSTVSISASESVTAKVIINEGLAKSSNLYITFENYMEFPYWISNGSGSMTINYDGDYTMYYQAIEIDDSDSIVDYDDDDWIESSDSSFTIDSSTYTGTKYFVLWIKLVTSDETYYGRAVYSVSGTYSTSSSSSSSTSSSSTSSNSSSSSSSNTDNTTSTSSLPYTGSSAVKICGILLIIFMIAVFYKKYHYYKDV